MYSFDSHPEHRAQIVGERHISGTLLQISNEHGPVIPEITVHHHNADAATCVSRIGAALLWGAYAYRMAAAASSTGDDRDLALPPDDMAETLDLSGPGIEDPDEHGGEV